MSGRTGRRPGDPGGPRGSLGGSLGGGSGQRALLPLLDRLIDDDPQNQADPPLSAADALAVLRAGVRRDLEALLNARRPWHAPPQHLSELRVSPLGWGIPDVTAGGLGTPRARERLRAEIEDTIRRFEPRFATLQVSLLENRDRLEPTLRLRIDAELHAEPAPEPVVFETILDATTSQAVVRAADEARRPEDV